MTSLFPSAVDADFAYIQQLLHARAGFILESDKHYLIETRIAPVLQDYGLASLRQLVIRLQTEPTPRLERATVEALVNGETSFFRDVYCFDSLRNAVLPRLIEERRADRTLRIWSAACSTGQEPYSIAMLLTESFPELADWDVRILATDISTMHLARARAGRYAQFEVNRGLPASLLVRHFDQEGTDWIIQPALRTAMRFSEINLVGDWPTVPPMDLVLLRNVMIYWDLETKQEVLRRVRRVLRPGGCLTLGAAETASFLDEAFERFSEDAMCCFRMR